MIVPRSLARRGAGRKRLPPVVGPVSADLAGAPSRRAVATVAPDSTCWTCAVLERSWAAASWIGCCLELGSLVRPLSALFGCVLGLLAPTPGRVRGACSPLLAVCLDCGFPVLAARLWRLICSFGLIPCLLL